MYLPTEDQILEVPRFNSFYRAPRTTDKLISQIANGARNALGLDSTYIWKTIRAIAASPWNRSHIEYDIDGYENYNIEGPQYSRVYAAQPLSLPGTGNLYPVLWIPDPDSPLEPDAIFPPIIPIISEEPIPDEILTELADPTRETIVLEPMTQEAADIAAQVAELATEGEQIAIQSGTDLIDSSMAIISDPIAPIEEKIAAINTIAEIANDDPEVSPAEIEALKTDLLEYAAVTDQPPIQPGMESIPLTQQADSSPFAALGPIVASFLFSRIAGGRS